MQSLPHRVTTCLLVTAAVAFACLLVGLLATLHAPLSSQAESHGLARLQSTAVALESTLGAKGDPNLQSLVRRCQREGGLEYCAVVSLDGKYLAHTNEDLVGKPAEAPERSIQWLGRMKRVQVAGAEGDRLRVFETQLRSDGRAYGSLRGAVPLPGTAETLAVVAPYAGTIAMPPLFVLAMGGFVAWQWLRPLMQIERQLSKVADAGVDAEVHLETIRGTGAVSTGWNRIVEGRSRADFRAGLHARLSKALEGFRQSKSDKVLNSLPEGIAVTDERGLITFANRPLAAMLGSSDEPSALEGRAFLACLDLDAEQAETLLDPARQERKVVVEAQRSDDSATTVLRIARHPLISENGTATTSHVWSLRDVTQQKLAEKMRNQFVASATHELRTPMTNIRAYAETLRLTDQSDVDCQKEFCNTIESEVNRLGRLIDDLLSIESMEVGSLSLARQETNFERLLRETLDKARPQMAERNISFDVELPEKLPTLHVDKAKIALTLVNLLGNAAKYTPEGGRVKLRVEVQDAAVHIHVEDTGIGISPEELPLVFEKFFRSTDPRVQQETGSGLGLAMAQEVVRLHGGKLSVQSEVEKGSVFTVTLPLESLDSAHGQGATGASLLARE